MKTIRVLSKVHANCSDNNVYNDNKRFVSLNRPGIL